MKNLILTGGIFHPFKESSLALEKILIKEGIESEITEDIEFGLKKIEEGDYDLMTVYALRWSMKKGTKYKPYRDQWEFNISASGRKSIHKFLEKGGGILGLHTAAICFDEWKDWISILGAKWIWGKSGHLPFGIVNTRTETIKHPIINNINAFNLEDEVFANLKMAKNITPLMSARVEGQDKWHPVLWARNFSNGRIVYDALGHDAKSINHPEHAKIIRRSANWAIGNIKQN
jgi:hypothetical protein